MRQVTRHDLRCFCRRQPLLAVYGIDERGKSYIHIKVYKNRRIFGEILITTGDAQIRCRECLRWYRVEIGSSESAKLIESTEPKSINEETASGHV